MLRFVRRPARAGSALLAGTVGGLLLLAAAASAQSPRALAEKVLEVAELDRGLCCVIGGGNQLALPIVRSSRFFVHVLAEDEAQVEPLRRAGEQAGFGIERLLIERAAPDRLPHADNSVDLLVATLDSSAALEQLAPDEALRVLRPEGRLVVIANKSLSAGAANTLKRWREFIRPPRAKVLNDRLGVFGLVTKSPLEGADEWTHWEHGPDNNPVSTDMLVQPPFMTQFLAEPFYITMPAITTAAGGRTFLATGHIAHHRREWALVGKLIARNGYNGIVLWERDLPQGYLAHRSAFIASKDTFYLMDGDGCLLLDAQTGREEGRLELPEVKGEWKWMALLDGVLYVLVGKQDGEAKVIKGDRNFGGWSWADLSEGYYGRPRVPWGFGHTLVAFQPGKKNLLGFRKGPLWRHVETTPIDSRALAISQGGIFLYCPDKHLRRLDAMTGKVMWTNDDAEVRELIEQPGRGLTSTPGFRSACLAVATPEALIVQGQTRMNVVAVSTKTGELLWQKKKFTNNPNVIHVNGTLIAGLGQRSSHVVLDPLTGEEIRDLNFRKAACTRLTASPGNLYVRGEGTLRYDLASDKAFIDGASRPGCNDGAIAAHGLLYTGPWACDCNLSLIGAMAKCSAGEFRVIEDDAKEERLWRAKDGKLAPFAVTAADWPTYRANVARSGATATALARPVGDKIMRASTWAHAPDKPFVPTPPVTAGDLVFVAGSDGKVRALDAKTGKLRWEFATGGPIKASPTIWEGRAYAGSGDGRVYALEAATGRLLWRFRAAPAERKIMVYGNLCSTWPVNTGVLVADGAAYFAAGIIDYDGTYVYAVDAKTGALQWCNDTSGHLNPEQRKGVSAQGGLTLLRGELLMAGGNQISPARFDLKTGECLNKNYLPGPPKTNHGKFAGVLFGKHPLVGGRGMYGSPANVANKDSFNVLASGRSTPLVFGGVPPAWDDRAIAFVNYRDGQLQCGPAAEALERIEKGLPRVTDDARGPRWRALADGSEGEQAGHWKSTLDQSEKFEVAAIAICPASVVILGQSQVRSRAHPEWWLAALNRHNGAPYWFWKFPLPSMPLPEGLAVGSEGQVIVALLNGGILSFGPHRPAPPRDAALQRDAAPQRNPRPPTRPKARD